MAAFELKLSSAMKSFRSRLPHFLLAVALAAPTAAVAQRLDPVYIEDRLNQLQQSITMLTGQLEQLQYRNQQLQQQMEKMQADYEYRLEQMEKGGGRPGGAPPPRPQTRKLQPRRRLRRRPRRHQERARTNCTTMPSRSCRTATTPARSAASRRSSKAIPSIRWRATHNTGWARPITRGAITRTP